MNQQQNFNIASFLSGLLFGVGLVISGMTQPAKVVGFLDLFGNWDPSLIFVMGGGVVTYGLLFKLIMQRPGPLFAVKFTVPTRRDMDSPLIVGSALFGIGWGLGGFCPGPALTSLTTLSPNVLVFLVMMSVGMYAADHVKSLIFRTAPA
ncbi:MAG: DUF6691 family protein [bacterium]|jgi:uncharacterized membrane protein YedE/YeeE